MYCIVNDITINKLIFFRVVASQLSSTLTKRILLTDPYRIKSPAEVVMIDFKLPLGVQLLQVYIEKEDYQDLLEDSIKSRTVFQYLNKKNVPKKVCIQRDLLGKYEFSKNVHILIILIKFMLCFFRNF